MDNLTCTHCGAGNSQKVKYCTSCGYELPIREAAAPPDNTQNSTNPRNALSKMVYSTIVGGVFFFLAYFGVQQFFVRSESINPAMMSAASEINKTCPIMLDAETRLDNAVALPQKTFQYNYTLVNLDKNDADTLAMINYLQPNIVNLAKTSPQMQFQRDQQWTLNYLYKDQSGQYLFMIVVTPDMYAE